MVKLKSRVLNIFSDPINSKFALMDYNRWICAWYAIYFSIRKLLWEKWSFSNTDVLLSLYLPFNLLMRFHVNNLWFLFSHLLLELYITFNTICLVNRMLLFSLQFNFFHLSSSFLTILRKFLNGISCRLLLSAICTDRNIMKLLESVPLLLIRPIYRQRLILQLHNNLLVTHCIDHLFLLWNDFDGRVFSFLNLKKVRKELVHEHVESWKDTYFNHLLW